MNLVYGLIISLLCIIAFVAEIILYFIFGLGTLFSGENTAFSGVVGIFLWLFGMTIVTGVTAPIAGAIEQFGKTKANKGWKILGATILCFAILFAVMFTFSAVKLNQALQNVNTNVAR